jgi:hypothetical protein
MNLRARSLGGSSSPHRLHLPARRLNNSQDRSARIICALAEGQKSGNSSRSDSLYARRTSVSGGRITPHRRASVYRPGISLGEEVLLQALRWPLGRCGRFDKNNEQETSSITPIQKTVAGRRFFAFVGIGLILFGVATIRMGRLYYHNYRGDNVFAPFAIVIGIIALTIFFRNRPSRNEG